MKKSIYILALLVGNFMFSQDFYKTIADETCDCLKKKDFELEKVSTDVLKTALGACMLSSYSAHEKDLKEGDKIQMSDQEGMKKFGESVAMKMLTSCPDVIVALGKGALNESETEEVAEDPYIEGEIVAFKSEQFVTDFETASLYTNGELKVKDKIKVTYSEYELYDAKNKEFKYYNVISALEKK